MDEIFYDREGGIMKIQLSVGITDIPVGLDGYKLAKEIILLAKAGILQRYSSRINFISGNGSSEHCAYKESCMIDIVEEEKVEKPPIVIGG